MALNARHLKQALRNYYFGLSRAGRVLQCATGYPGRSYLITTAKIEWCGKRYRGSINKADLSVYLGSDDAPDYGNTPVTVWNN